MKLQTKLLITIISLMLIPLLALGILSMNLIAEGIGGQAQAKINGDLGGARAVYQGMEDKLQIIAYSLAAKGGLSHGINNFSHENAISLIQSVKEQYPFISTIIITDNSGKIIARSNYPDIYGDNLFSDPFVASALDGNEIKGTIIVPEEELSKDKLDSQARIEFVPTENAMPADKKVETKGMMIKASSPVINDGKITGSVVVGHLINRDNTIVDETANTVNVETSTIFMNDLRISTNVKKPDGGRAIGTMISIPVYDAVLKEEKKFFGRAFVVNGWYITAYEPLYDINHKVIGALYVGTSEAPFGELKKEAQQNLLLIGMVSLILSILLGIFISKKLVKPIDSMYRASDKVATVAQALTLSVEEINATIEQISAMTQGIAKGASQNALMMNEISRASKEMLESVQKRCSEFAESC